MAIKWSNLHNFNSFACGIISKEKCKQNGFDFCGFFKVLLSNLKCFCMNSFSKDSLLSKYREAEEIETEKLRNVMKCHVSTSAVPGTDCQKKRNLNAIN